MVVDAWLYGVGLAVCAVLLALAAAAQVAFAQLNGVRLRQLMQRGISRSEAIAEVVRDPGGLGAAIGIAHLTAIAVAAGLSVHGVMAFDLMPPTGAAALFGAGAVLLIAQTLGRGIGVVRPEAVATRLYGPVRVIAIVTGPLVKLDNLFVRSILRWLLGASPEEHTATTEEDLRALVDVVDETGGLERDEREMITSIFEMSDRDVAEIMVPRLDMVVIESVRSITDALDLAVASGHSRFPVIDGDLDHVLGVVHLRDLAGALRKGEVEKPLATLVRPVHVVPESKKIDELLRDLQTMRTQMALVVDEYGGTAGLVTIEDLLEEIVGEIRDEYDTEEDPIQVLSDREVIMKATVSIHDANEALPLHLEDVEYETLAGLVYNELGRVPVPGDLVKLATCTIKVLTTNGRRVQRVHITLDEASSGQAEQHTPAS